MSRCFTFRALITQARIWKRLWVEKFVDKFTLFTHFLVGWNLENLQKHAVSIFFRLSWHFKREKPVFWKASFLQNKDWLHVQVREQDFATGQNFSFNQYSKQAREFCFFLSGKLFHKSNKKLFYMRLHILIYTLEGLREFSTVMQTLDFFSGLHNHLELSQVLWCLYQAM